MRRLALVVVSAGAFASSAIAADVTIPKKAVTKALPPAATTGSPISIYVGAHIGAGWSRFASDAAIETINGTGILGGLQLGANWQTGNTVFGVEADVSAAAVRGNGTGTIAGAAATSTARNRWFATLAGRLGQSFGRTLGYVKAGGAWTRYEWDFTGAAGALHGPQSRLGWMVGAGVEQAVTDVVSVKLEYNYLDFGKKLETFAAAGPLVVAPVNVRLNVHAVKLGVNYRFVSAR